MSNFSFNNGQSTIGDLNKNILKEEKKESPLKNVFNFGANFNPASEQVISFNSNFISREPYS